MCKTRRSQTVVLVVFCVGLIVWAHPRPCLADAEVIELPPLKSEPEITRSEPDGDSSPPDTRLAFVRRCVDADRRLYTAIERCENLGALTLKQRKAALRDAREALRLAREARHLARRDARARRQHGLDLGLRAARLEGLLIALTYAEGHDGQRDRLIRNFRQAVGILRQRQQRVGNTVVTVLSWAEYAAIQECLAHFLIRAVPDLPCTDEPDRFGDVPLPPHRRL